MPPRNRESGARPNVANVSLHAYPVDGLVIPNAVCLPASGAEAGTGRYASTRSGATSRSSTRRSTIVASTCAPSPTRCRCSRPATAPRGARPQTIGDRRQWWPGTRIRAGRPAHRSQWRSSRTPTTTRLSSIRSTSTCAASIRGSRRRRRGGSASTRSTVASSSPTRSPPASSCQRRPESSPVSAPVRHHVRPAPPQSPPSTSRGNAASPPRSPRSPGRSSPRWGRRSRRGTVVLPAHAASSC